jgi:methionine-rich copper-binding protein CopC
MQAKEIPVKLHAALGSDSAAVADSANALREIGSAAFNDKVSMVALQTWITQINTKHGKLTSTSRDSQQFMSTMPDGVVHLNFNGKFVNGPASIRLIFKAEQLWSMRIDDIEIDGSSPRVSAMNSPASTKKEPPSAIP